MTYEYLNRTTMKKLLSDIIDEMYNQMTIFMWFNVIDYTTSPIFGIAYYFAQ